MFIVVNLIVIRLIITYFLILLQHLKVMQNTCPKILFLMVQMIHLIILILSLD